MRHKFFVARLGYLGLLALMVITTGALLVVWQAGQGLVNEEGVSFSLSVHHVQEQEVLGQQTYATVLLTSPSYKSVQLWLTPLSSNQSQWSYRLDWTRKLNRIGSIALNGDYKNLLVDWAEPGGSVEFSVKAGQQFKLEFISKPYADFNNGAVVLVRKYYNSPQVKNYSVEAPPASKTPSTSNTIQALPKTAVSPVAPGNGGAPLTSQLGVYYWGGQVINISPNEIMTLSKKLGDDLGLNVIRISLSSKADKDYKNSTSCIPNFSLASLAARPDFNAILTDQQFSTVIITAYDGVTFGDCINKHYLDTNFLTPTVLNQVSQEYMALANYLKQYNKNFIIANWEADNDLYCGNAFNATTTSCSNTTNKFSAYTAWAKAWIAGVKSANAGNVKTAFEFNNVHSLEKQGLYSALNNIVPALNPDYFSYSSYESINYSTTQTSQDIDFIRNKLSGFGKNSATLFFGEVGFDAAGLGTTQASTRLSDIIKLMTQKNIPYAIVWNLINNPGFGIYDSLGNLTSYGQVIKKGLPGDTGSVPPPPPPPVSVTLNGLQGYNSQTQAYTNFAGSDNQYLVLYGQFNGSNNTVYVNGLAFKPVYQSTSQLNVKLDSTRLAGTLSGISVPVYVDDGKGNKTTAVNFTLMANPSLAGVQGYNVQTQSYTNNMGNDNQYLILYGTFFPAGNTVYINQIPFTPLYQSPSQINVKLDPAKISGMAMGKIVTVVVTSNNGQSTNQSTFTLLPSQ